MFTKSYFSSSFDLVITWLPFSLTHLKFSATSRFNHPISCLPPSLIKLEFGILFNSPPNPPDSLQYISFSHYFNTEITHLPTSLKMLKSAGLTHKLPQLTLS